MSWWQWLKEITCKPGHDWRWIGFWGLEYHYQCRLCGKRDNTNVKQTNIK